MSASKQAPRYFAATRDDGSVLHLTVRRPTRAESSRADLASSRVFNDCLGFGLPTQKRQLRTLAESGQWTEVEAAKTEALRAKAVRLEAQLSPDLDKAAYDAINTARIEATVAFREMRGELDSMLQHTCESKSAIEYRNFIIACVVEYAATDADGNPVNQDKQVKSGDGFFMSRLWASIDDLADDIDGELLERVLYEHLMFTAGLPSEWGTLRAVSAAAEAITTTSTTASEVAVTATTPTTTQIETPPAVVTADPAVATVPA